MKKNAAITTGWSRRYQTALRKYLGHGSGASLRSAQALGREAVALGLVTLDLARIHEQALAAVVSPRGSARIRQRVIERAKIFFAEAIVPIEKTHRAARKTEVRVHQLTQALRRRMVESSASTRHLERGIVQRQAAQAALKNSGTNRIRLLQESSSLHNRWRRQARAILEAQENERQKTSRQLHDEIAQALLAINLWLLMVKTSAQATTANFKKEIDSTQRLVKDSSKRLGLFTHECFLQHKA